MDRKNNRLLIAGEDSISLYQINEAKLKLDIKNESQIGTS